jgi:hypothetical protein
MAVIPKVGDNIRLKNEPAPLRTYRVIEVDELKELATCRYLDDHIEQNETILPFADIEIIDVNPIV